LGILINKDTKLLVQGITGSVGSFQTKQMQDFGTNVVAGVTPGKGGSKVNGSFLHERLVDKFYFFLSPKWIGDQEAPGIFGGHGIKDLQEAVTLKDIRARRVGEDFLLEGYVIKGSDPCSQGL